MQHNTLHYRKKDSTYQRRIFRTCGLTLTTHTAMYSRCRYKLLASKEKLKAAWKKGHRESSYQIENVCSSGDFLWLTYNNTVCAKYSQKRNFFLKIVALIATNHNNHNDNFLNAFEVILQTFSVPLTHYYFKDFSVL